MPDDHLTDDQVSSLVGETVTPKTSMAYNEDAIFVRIGKNLWAKTSQEVSDDERGRD